MASPSYRRLQRAIARDDRRGIEARWLYGRALLGDPRKMSAAGRSLRDGAIEALIADARAVGSTLSRREIQYRLQCARTYPTVAQLRTAACAFEDWTAFREAGFPPVDDADQAPAEAAADHEEELRRQHQQLDLFPAVVAGVPFFQATLRQLAAHASEMERMTANYARRDTERREYLERLTAAVGGDLDATYGDASHALKTQMAGAS